MKRLIEKWMTERLNQIHILGPVATSAFVAGGAFNTLAVGFVWLLHEHELRERSS